MSAAAASTSSPSSSRAATALSTVLSSNPASRLPHGRPDAPIIELASTTSPLDAARTLWSHNILGAPVYDEAAGKYVGFFDMRDILSCVVAAAKAEKESGAAAAAAAEGSDETGADAKFSFQEKMVKVSSSFYFCYLYTILLRSVQRAGGCLPLYIYLFVCWYHGGASVRHLACLSGTVGPARSGFVFGLGLDLVRGCGCGLDRRCGCAGRCPRVGSARAGRSHGSNPLVVTAGTSRSIGHIRAADISYRPFGHGHAESDSFICSTQHSRTAGTTCTDR